MPNPPSNFRDVHPSNFRNVHAFLHIFLKVVTVPLRKSALHCAARTSIHIAGAPAHAPTAAKKESLLEKEFLQILAEPIGELDFEVQSREARQHPRSPTELEEKRLRAISPFAQTRRASYPGRLLSDHPAPPMPVAPTSVAS